MKRRRVSIHIFIQVITALKTIWQTYHGTIQIDDAQDDDDVDSWVDSERVASLAVDDIKPTLLKYSHY